MPLITLPNEILLIIWEFLPRNDGLTFRLSCKRHYKLTAPLVFTKLAFRLCKADMDMLRYLADNIEYAQFIRSLEYLWADIPTLNTDQLNDVIPDAEDQSKYSKAAAEKMALAKAQSDLKCLQHILPKLSNLDEFHATCAEYPNLPLLPVYRQSLGHREFDVVLKAILHSQRDVKTLGEIMERVNRWCCRQGQDTPCPLLDFPGIVR